MFRSGFSFLLIVAALFPSGMCLCDYGLLGAVASKRSHQLVPDFRPSCDCQHHKHSAPVTPEEHHAPGCPAKVGTGEWKAESSPTPKLCVPSPLFAAWIVPYDQGGISGSLRPACHGQTADHPPFLAALRLRI